MTRAPRPLAAPPTAALAALPTAAFAALLTAALAAPALAQQSLTPEAFLEIARGKTLTFADADTGLLVGVERFLPGRRTIWTRADGTCAYGTVSIRGPELCFVYDDGPGRGPHCWWPLREGTSLYVRLADAERSETQRITEIGDEPLSCAAVPSV